MREGVVVLDWAGECDARARWNPSLARALGGTGFLPSFSSSSILPKGVESTCEVRLPYKERTANAIEGNHIGTWMDGQINERFLWRLHADGVWVFLR